MKKRLASLFVALCLLLTMLPMSAFAADGNGISVSKTQVSNGETFAVTLEIPTISEALCNIEFNISFNSDVFEVTEYATPTFATMSNSVSEANAAGRITCSNASATGDNTLTDLQSGGSMTATFKVKDTAVSGSYEFTVSKYTVDSLDESTYESIDRTPAGAVKSVSVTVGSTVVKGYTAQVTADEAVTVGQNVNVYVGVGHDTDSTFHAAEIVLNYDAAKLELVTAALEANQQIKYTNVNGVLTIENFDEEHNMGTSSYAIQFKANVAGETAITLSSAKFLHKTAADSSNLIPATTINPNTATIQVKEETYSVTTADGSDTTGLTIPVEVTKGNNLVISAVDTNLWDYTITAKIGETTVDVTGPVDGKFTIASSAITGDIVLTTSRSGHPFDVEWTGDGYTKVQDRPNQAIYNTDFQFRVPGYQDPTSIESGYNYIANVRIEGSDYTLSGIAGQTVTIPGAQITGKVTIEIDEIEVPANGKSASIKGEDVTFSDGSTSIVASPGENVTLVLTPEAGYDYTIKVGATDVTGEFEGDNEYTFALDDHVTITVTKTLVTENLVTVSNYVRLDSEAGLQLWLVVFKPTLEDDKIPTYDYANMFWSEKYSGYCYLVKATELNVADAAAKLAVATATAVPVDYTGNVNQTTEIDAADAQFVANMYNAMYDMDGTVTMPKFLSADMDGNGILNIEDAKTLILEKVLKTTN